MQMKVEQVKKIPTFTPTKQQRKWIEKEKLKTGNSFSTILKGLIQQAMESK